MDTISMVVVLQHLKTKKSLDVILTGQYVKMYGIGMVYTIGDHQAA